MTWSWIALPHVLNGSGTKLFFGFRDMIANIPVCYAHRSISGLSFLHRGKRLSLFILRKCCVMSDYFLLFNLFQLDFSCTHVVSLSLFLLFFLLSLQCTCKTRRLSILQTAKKCYSSHSLIPFSSPSILSTCTQK